MTRFLIFAVASFAMLAVAASAEETVPQRAGDEAVVCDACSARKKGLLKLREAREAEKAEADTATLAPQDARAEE